MNTLVWAHRGASHDAPENTMEAFDLAARQGADGIELDIHLTTDGQLAVFHDDLLDRVTDAKGLVEERSMPQLKQLNAGVLHPRYAGAKIPTLTEVFDFLKGNDMLVNVEIKEERPPNRELTLAAAKLVRDYQMQERVIFSSFNHYSLQAIQAELPGVRTGILYKCHLALPWEYAKVVGASCLHPHWTIMLLEGEIAKSQAAGLAVNIWTVDDPSLIRKVLAQSPDGIITNYPDLALQIRSGVCAPD